MSTGAPVASPTHAGGDSDRTGTPAAYAFGLSYTTFRLDGLDVGPLDGEQFHATMTVTNTGDRDGRHVVQIYARGIEGVPTLVGFRAVEAPVGPRCRSTSPAALGRCNAGTVHSW